MAPTEDGHYWLRIWINLDGGGLVDEWRMAKIEGGVVSFIGSTAKMPLTAPYLKRAVWSDKVIPPPVTSS